MPLRPSGPKATSSGAGGARPDRLNGGGKVSVPTTCTHDSRDGRSGGRPSTSRPRVARPGRRRSPARPAPVDRRRGAGRGPWRTASPPSPVRSRRRAGGVPATVVPGDGHRIRRPWRRAAPAPRWPADSRRWRSRRCPSRFDGGGVGPVPDPGHGGGVGEGPRVIGGSVRARGRHPDRRGPSEGSERPWRPGRPGGPARVGPRGAAGAGPEARGSDQPAPRTVGSTPSHRPTGALPTG